jgi:hypothetical protein
MLSSTNVVYFLAHKFARLSCGRFALAAIPFRSLESLSFRHGVPQFGLHRFAHAFQNFFRQALVLAAQGEIT